MTLTVTQLKPAMHPHPVLAFGFVELIIIGLILAALVVLALWWFMNRMRAGVPGPVTPGGGGGTPLSSPTPSPVDELTKLITAVRDSGEVTAGQCQEMRSLLQQIRDAGAPPEMLDPLEAQIEELCSGQ